MIASLYSIAHICDFVKYYFEVYELIFLCKNNNGPSERSIALIFFILNILTKLFKLTSEILYIDYIELWESL